MRGIAAELSLSGSRPLSGSASSLLRAQSAIAPDSGAVMEQGW
ncbi:hypothetical protein [Paenibacillus melissococcoides]|nr:hypothetical protein [Paenibacillus melissococcoides]